MAFAPGQYITAQRLNRLQNKTYLAEGGTIAAGAGTNVDIPGVTLTFTSETDNAVAHCFWTVDFTVSAGATPAMTSRLLLDGVTSSTRFIAVVNLTSGERSQPSMEDSFDLGTAGSHTIKAQVTKAANQAVAQYCVLRVEVEEIV
jgi:hypothetical protein